MSSIHSLELCGHGLIPCTPTDKPMTELTQKEFARMGGLAVKKKYGRAFYKEIRKKRKTYKNKLSTGKVIDSKP